MSQSGQTFLFFIKSPDLKNILSFTADIVFGIQKSNLSLFHCRILKCRELVFTDPDVVATPSNSSTSQITAVIPKKKFYSAQFQQKLERMKLRILEIRDASPAHLQECLQYTVAAKLAPHWNCVQDLLVQGRDFLTVSGFLRAIKLDMYVSDSEITLTVIPMCIKLPPFNIEIYLRMYEYSGKSIRIEEKCHVLPSLKVGRATSLSRTLLPTDMFRNYGDFKKHWKNMYGYRLPDVPEEKVWYLNVEFNIPFSPSYFYPVFCVRPYGMTEVPRIDPQLTLNAFISDFCKKVNNVCSEKCELLDLKASFPTAMLYPAQDVVEDMHPKLGTSYTMIHNKPYRSCTVQKLDNEKYKSKQQNESNITGRPPLTCSALKENKQNEPQVNEPGISKFKANETACQSTSYSDKSMNREKKIPSSGESQNRHNLDFNPSQNNNTVTNNDDNKDFSKIPNLSISSKRDWEESKMPSSINIGNSPEQISLDESKKTQIKYAPKFYPRKSKPEKALKITDYFTEMKSRKYSPSFSVSRKNNALSLQPAYKTLLQNNPNSSSSLNPSDFPYFSDKKETQKRISRITFQSNKSSSAKVVEKKPPPNKKTEANASSRVVKDKKVNTVLHAPSRKKTKV